VSWWPIPDSPGDVTGDAAVDAVDAALFALVCAREGAGKPSLGEIARALSDALAPARVGLAEGETADSAPEDVARAVQEALSGLTAAYERAFDRPPRLTETLYTFTFAFGGQPEAFVRGPLPAGITFRAD
jgi:hypothetical protein